MSPLDLNIRQYIASEISVIPPKFGQVVSLHEIWIEQYHLKKSMTYFQRRISVYQAKRVHPFDFVMDMPY